jgi:hypothetical protein
MLTISSLQCYQLCLPPLVSDSPACPLPDPDENPGWYGESWVRYTLDESLYPLNHPNFFKAKCDFSIILNQISTSLFDGAGKDSSIIINGLRDHLKNLGNWHYFLPTCLKPEKVIYPFQLNLQSVTVLSVL